MFLRDNFYDPGPAHNPGSWWMSFQPLVRWHDALMGWVYTMKDSMAELFLPRGVYRFVFRENRVPYYQRLFQKHDGKRQWYKVSAPLPGQLIMSTWERNYGPDIRFSKRF